MLYFIIFPIHIRWSTPWYNRLIEIDTPTNTYSYIHSSIDSGLRMKKFQGHQGFVRPRTGVPGADRPGRQRIFEKLQIKFLKKIAKMQYFSIFFENIKKPCVTFSLDWTNDTKCLEFFINFRKLSKNLLSKLRKKHYFRIFFKNLNKHGVIFRAFVRKTQIHRNFW